MSSTPKYNQAQLRQQEQERLETERRRQAQDEARQRREAEARERYRRVEELRGRLVADVQRVVALLAQQQNSLYPRDFLVLQERGQCLASSLQSAESEKRLHEVAIETPRLKKSLSEAQNRKRRDDEEKQRREEIDRQRFRLSDVEQQLAEVPTPEASKFDPEGRQAASQAIRALRPLLAVGNPALFEHPLEHAEALVQAHIDTVAQRHADWTQRKAKAEQAVGEIHTLLVGLQADPILMRWHGNTVKQLEASVTDAERAIVAEEFARPSEILLALQSQKEQMLVQANAAQLKKDQCNYIAKSVAQTLSQMGFTISPIRAEHPGHPASALVFHAATTAGKAINVSVPVEGQILYNVDGYPKKTKSVTGGGSSPVCDEAEGVLNEMREKLNAAFGVQSSEIMWNGKVDPNRIIKEAKPLSDGSGEHGGRAS